jgi:hypothetical protein
VTEFDAIAGFLSDCGAQPLTLAAREAEPVMPTMLLV